MEYKTSCCKTGYYRERRGVFKCNKCNTDVTIEVMLLYDYDKKEIKK